MKNNPTAQALTHMLLENAPQRKKAEYLSSYLKIAVNEGFEAATLTRIAQEHKTSKALVHYYLPDLNTAALELFTLCAKHGAEFTVRMVEKNNAPKEKLVALLRAPFYWFFEHHDFGRFLILMYQNASVDKKLSEVHKKTLEMGRKRLTNAFQQLHGEFAKEAEKKAHIVHSQMIATLILMHSTSDTSKESPFLSNYEYLVDKVLGIKLKVFLKV